MSRQELVEAYIDGRITRRVFIRRLVATGVSVGAAMTYAAALSPQAQAADTLGIYDGQRMYEHYTHEEARV